MPIWRKDWCLFAEQILHVDLDDEQKDVLRSVQDISVFSTSHRSLMSTAR